MVIRPAVVGVPRQNGRTAFHAGTGLREFRRELAKIIIERGAHDVVAIGTLLDRCDAEPLQFILRDGNHNATQLFAVLGLPRFGMNGPLVARDQRRARHWRDRHNNGRRRVTLAGKQACGNGCELR